MFLHACYKVEFQICVDFYIILKRMKYYIERRVAIHNSKLSIFDNEWSLWKNIFEQNFIFSPISKAVIDSLFFLYLPFICVITSILIY